MATSNYTPGPWKLAAGRLIETTSGGFTIGREGWNGSPVELDANARLAAAAPELLSALAAMLGAAEVDCVDDKSNVWRSAMIDAQAAIAKAEGRA